MAGLMDTLLDWMAYLLLGYVLLLMWQNRQSRLRTEKNTEEIFAALDRQDMEAPCGIHLTGAQSLGMLILHQEGEHVLGGKQGPLPQVCWRCKDDLPNTGTDWPELTRLGHTITADSRN